MVASWGQQSEPSWGSSGATGRRGTKGRCMGSVVSFLLVSSKDGHPRWPRCACTVCVVMTLSSPVTLREIEQWHGGPPHTMQKLRQKREGEGRIISLAQGTTTSLIDRSKACNVCSGSGAGDRGKTCRYFVTELRPGMPPPPQLSSLSLSLLSTEK